MAFERAGFNKENQNVPNDFMNLIGSKEEEIDAARTDLIALREKIEASLLSKK